MFNFNIKKITYTCENFEYVQFTDREKIEHENPKFGRKKTKIESLKICYNKLEFLRNKLFKKISFFLSECFIRQLPHGFVEKSIKFNSTCTGLQGNLNRKSNICPNSKRRLLLFLSSIQSLHMS